MSSILQWYNLIFYISLAVGLLLLIGSATGLGHFDTHLDTADDADADADADGDGDGDGDNILSLLGFGRVPIMIVFTIMTLVFGGAGLAMNAALAWLLAISEWFVVVSIAGSFVVMLFSTAIIARALAKVMPTTETTSTTKQDLVGSSGTLLLSSDETGGLAQVTMNGDVYNFQCKSSESITKGEKILVTEYNEEEKTYFVCKYPL